MSKNEFYYLHLKNEKSWILKTVYGKHLLNFSDFLIFLDRPNLPKNTFRLSCHELRRASVMINDEK